MKIKTIRKISNFGVFKNYAGDIKEFGTNNLIFGWNYSGKTTLSRIFQSLEIRALPSGFENGAFLIEQEDGTTVSSENLEGHDLQVRVFNSDYVRNNLKWEEREGELPPLFAVGSRSIELEEKIQELDVEKTNLSAELSDLRDREKEAKEAIGAEMTQTARRISQDLRLGNRFNRTNLKQLLSNQDVDTWELEEAEYNKNRAVVLQGAKMDDVRPLNVPIHRAIYQVTSRLLTQVVTPSKTLERLADSNIENWARQGLQLHRDQDACMFCGGPLTPAVMAELDAHFSKDYKEFVSRIEQHIEFLSKAKISFNSLPEVALYPDLREEYNTALRTLETVVNQYNHFIAQLIERTREKLAKPTVSVHLDGIPEFGVGEIEKAVERVNAIIRIHNEKTSEFEKNQEVSTELLKRHYAALFYRERDYANRITQIEKYELQIGEIESKIESCKIELDRYEAEASDIVKGAYKVQEYMDEYFGGNSPLSIHVTEDKKFQLMRGEVPAKNLSEGEKTAIVFSYFLASLHDRETAEKLHKTIVYIDDPVSSLDANHLYNTYAIINVYLKDKCAQLFISTHNHEFFKLIKDEFKPFWNRQLSCNFNTTGSHSNRSCNSPLYMVTRSGEISQLSNIDCLLCHFNSEYYYVFKELYEYALSDKDDYFKAYTMPNLLRRFLDVYMRFNYPETVHGRLTLSPLIEESSEEKLVHKIIDELSHNEVVERTMKIPEPQETRKAINITFQAIKKTRPDYFKELVGATQVSEQGSLEAAAGKGDI